MVAPEVASGVDVVAAATLVGDENAEFNDLGVSRELDEDVAAGGTFNGGRGKRRTTTGEDLEGGGDGEQ